MLPQFMSYLYDTMFITRHRTCLSERDTDKKQPGPDFATVISVSLLVDGWQGKKRGEKLALKLLHNSRVGEAARRFEAETAASFANDYIIKTFDWFQMSGEQIKAKDENAWKTISGIDCGILMELADTTLERFVYDQSSDTGRQMTIGWLQTCQRRMQEMAKAVKYLHQDMKVAHRDLKPDNVLLKKMENGDFRVLISDFSLVKGTQDFAFNSVKGANPYHAPERSQTGTGWENEENIQKGDVYSLGLIFTAMAHRKRRTNPDAIDPDFKTAKGNAYTWPHELQNLILYMAKESLQERKDILWVTSGAFFGELGRLRLEASTCRYEGMQSAEIPETLWPREFHVIFPKHLRVSSCCTCSRASRGAAVSQCPEGTP